MAKNIFISWFPIYHGLAFMKHILAKFYDKSITPENYINLDNIDQDKAEKVWQKLSSGFFFDKIVIITPDNSLKKAVSISSKSRRIALLSNDELIAKEGTLENWKEVISKNFGSIKEEIKYIKGKYDGKTAEKMLNQYWRNIQHYPLNEQIWWLKNLSNLPKAYVEKIEFRHVKRGEVKDYYDYKNMTQVTYQKLRDVFRKYPNANYIIHLGVSGHVVPVAFYSVAAAGLLPKKSKFIESSDRKDSAPGKKIKNFFIRELPTQLLSHLQESLKIYEQRPISTKRKEIELKFQTFIKQGFSILLLGERGTGKSHLANRYSKNENFVAVNCATFIDSHIAESELFGYKKGAFTDAKTDKKGLIEEAHNGILFMDEIHTLPLSVQYKLMRAFATDDKNQISIRRIGESKERKIKLKGLIMASNQSIEKLKEMLLPDFFDRVAQLIIELPPLRQTPEEIPKAFEVIWKQLLFEESYNYKLYPGKDTELLNWLKTLPLPGNYRDLQRIAINYKTYLEFPEDLRLILKEKTPYQYTKHQYEQYFYSQPQEKNKYFSTTQTSKQMLQKFKKDLAIWAISTFGSAPKAVEHFKSLGEEITQKTLYTWKNGNKNT